MASVVLHVLELFKFNICIVYGPKWPYWIYILDYITLFGIGYAGFRQVLYLGRAPCTKETLPDFHEKMSGHPTFTSILRVEG